MNKFDRILSSFTGNQIRQINDFLNSADGQKLKKHIGDTDKAKLMEEFGKLNPEQVKRAFSGITKDDLAKIFGKK